MTRLRWVLGLLFALVLSDQLRYDFSVLNRLRHQDRYCQEPFYIDGKAGNTVIGYAAAAHRAGIRRGDRILAIEGREYTNTGIYSDELRRLKPGETMHVKVQTSLDTPRDLAIPLQQMHRETDLVLTLILQLFVLLLCLPLGFGVAYLKPADTRSWVLLWMVLGFIPTFRFFQFYSDLSLASIIGYVLNVFVRETWPLSMILLAIFFPERMRFESGALRVLRALLYPAGTFVILHAALIFAQMCARVTSIQTAQKLVPLINATMRPDIMIGMSMIGGFFGLIGYRFGMVKTQQERRRLILLNAGSHVAFVPMFIIVLRALIRKQDTFAGLPIWISVPSIVLLLLFPLTLSYLILAHRALDIRVVLRTGLQYALANRAVNALRVLLTYGGIVYALRFVQENNRRVENLLAISLAVTFIILGNRGATRIKAWMDRRFFREEYNAEQVLSGLSTDVRRMLDAGKLVETVSRRIAESLHVSQVATLLRGPSGFTPAFALGYDTPLETAFATDAPVPRRLSEARSPQRVFLDDPNSWVNKELDGHPDRAYLAAMHSQLLLPIEGHGELAGFISLGAKLSEEPYSGSDLQLLQSVAAQTGLALENTRLTSEMARDAAQRERLDQEMEIARHVQERLFPQRRPEIPGIDYAGECRPAQSVGGDSYDFLDLDSGEFCFSIGDVSGKGIPAAILMAVVQTSIRSHTMAGSSDLAGLMRNVNRIVEEASPKKHFATLFYAQYQPLTKTLRYVNAAHNPPLLLRANGDHAWLRPTGLALGWSKKAVFGETSMALASGDVLILYTDGITEAMNPALEEFGEDRLLETGGHSRSLHPEAIIPAILHAVDQFATGEAQHDDMTMVVVKVR